MSRRIDLRRQLAEDDHADGQRETRDRHGVGVAGALRQDRRDGRGKHAGGGEDHEIRAQPVIRLLQQPLEDPGGALAPLGAMLYPIAVDGQHRDLGARGERHDREQNEQRQQQRGSRSIVQGSVPRS